MAKSYENPLIPHVRMRALFRGLVEARALGERSPKLEAVFVATAIDLRDGDLSVNGDNTIPLAHLSGVGRRPAARAALRSEVAAALRSPAASTAQSGFERLLIAVGMAAAVKAAGDGCAVLAYAGSEDLSPSEWKRTLLLASECSLPLVVVTLPSRGGKLSVAEIVRRTPLRAVPVIPVDAGDAIAIYRVAQESLLRARSNGGVAVIESVACGTDPIELLGRQLTSRGIATQRWIAAVEPAFRSTLAKVRELH